MVDGMRNRMGLFASAILVIAIAGCATTPLTISTEEIEGLLTWQRSAGLNREQAAELRALVERSRESQRALARHLRGERRTFDRLMAKGHAIDAPDIWAQASLVHQLRVEWLFASVLLREEARTRLTPAQREWMDRNRLMLIFSR